MKDIRILKEAEIELFEAVSYYEEQQIGLGLDFESEIRRAFFVIQSKPDLWVRRFKEFRRFFLQRFPFDVWYIEEVECIRVYAIAHHRSLHRKWYQTAGRVANSLKQISPESMMKRDVEDDTVTHVEVGNDGIAKGEISSVSIRGSKLWYGSRETNLNSGGLLAYSKRGRMNQQTEGHPKGIKEVGVRSVIVLRDGKTDHMGKELTSRLKVQGAHVKRGKQILYKRVSSTLLELKLRNRSEEPYAGKPHVGICKGISRKRLVLS